MAGRMVDVNGVSPEGVLYAAATQPAYGDEPFDRVALLCGWVGRGECTRAEVVAAVEMASGYLDEDPTDTEAAAAWVVLSEVVRLTS